MEWGARSAVVDDTFGQVTVGPLISATTGIFANPPQQATAWHAEPAEPCRDDGLNRETATAP